MNQDRANQKGRVDREEVVLGIRHGLESMRAGEGIPADEAFARLADKHGINPTQRPKRSGPWA